MSKAKLIEKAAFCVTAFRDRWRLKQSQGELDQVVRGVLDICQSTETWPGQTGKQFDRIESLREKLRSSDEVISFVDYGTGDGLQENSAVGEKCSAPLQRIVEASSPPWFGRFLHHLIIGTKATRVLELGACVGITASYAASALDVLGTGKLITVEGAQPLAKIAAENLESVSPGRGKCITGRFHDCLTDVLEELGHVDVAFIDGHHHGPATLEYFDQIATRCSPNAVCIFDDIRWPTMRSAWRELKSDKRIHSSFDLYTKGICVLGENPTGKVTQFNVMPPRLRRRAISA